MHTISTNPESYRGEFLAAVCCFVLAAAAGVLLRFVGAGVALPEHIDYSNLRRAHSHLMLFGWVTPGLFALIAARVRPSRAMRTTIRATLLLGLASFGPFLLWGYEAASLGNANVPVSVIVSTLNMFAWYVFAGLYVRMRPDLKDRVGETAVRFWDGALFLLVVGSAGAWARGAFIGLGIEDPFLTKGAVEFFLTTFVDGFLILGVLGFVMPRGTRRFVGPLVLATLFEFPAFITSTPVPEAFALTGSVAVVVAGGIVAWLGVVLARRRFLIGALVVTLGVGKMLLASTAFAEWAVGSGLRIPYLHLALLGAVTLALFRIASETWKRLYVDPMVPAVLIALVALLPTTALWPAELPRDLGLLFTALCSMAPLGVAIAILWGSWRAVKPQLPVLSLTAFDPVLPTLTFDDANEG